MILPDYRHKLNDAETLRGITPHKMKHTIWVDIRKQYPTVMHYFDDAPPPRPPSAMEDDSEHYIPGSQRGIPRKVLVTVPVKFSLRER